MEHNDRVREDMIQFFRHESDGYTQTYPEFYVDENTMCALGAYLNERYVKTGTGRWETLSEDDEIYGDKMMWVSDSHYLPIGELWDEVKRMNDDEHLSFKEIADRLEQMPS